MTGRDSPAEARGVIPNAIGHIFDHVKASSNVEFLVRCSFLEIYNEDVCDLLATDAHVKLELREDVIKGVFVKDLRHVVVQNAEAMQRVLKRGIASRCVGARLMNQESYRWKERKRGV